MPDYSSNILFDCEHATEMYTMLNAMMALKIMTVGDIKEFLTVQDEVHICLAEFKRQLRVSNPRYRGGRMSEPPKDWMEP